MSLGTLTVTKKIELGNAKLIKATLVGDAAYAAGGTAGLLAALKSKLEDAGLGIADVKDITGPAAISKLEYDHANDKLFARVKTTGVESAVADQSAITYTLHITAY